MKEKYVFLDGRSLWSQSIGSHESKNILLISGANASALMWPDEFMELLAINGYRVIRYDHRDTGLSSFNDFNEFPYKIQDLASDSVSILNAWGVDKAHIVGFSMGATLGQVIAIDYSNRVHSLTLMCGAALDVDFVANVDKTLLDQNSDDGLPLPKKEALEMLSIRNIPSKTIDEEIDRRINEWRLLSGEKLKFDEADIRHREKQCINHAGTWTQPSNHNLATPIPLCRGNELSKICVPVLVIQGSEDPLNPPPHGKHLADLIPNARLVEIDGLGHCLPNELLPLLVDKISYHVEKSYAAFGYSYYKRLIKNLIYLKNMFI